MPKIVKNGKEYSGVPTEVVTAWQPTGDSVQVAEPLMGNTDISSIGDGTVTGAVSSLSAKLTDVETDLSGRRKILYMDVSDTTPVNLQYQTSGTVTRNNFISAVCRDDSVICLPYYRENNSVMYIALKDTSLNAVSGTKNVRVYYWSN